MLDIDRGQYRMLKRIKNHPNMPTADLSKEEKEICRFLARHHFVTYRPHAISTQDGTKVTHGLPDKISTTQEGNAQLYIFRTTFHKWWIPLVIAIIAAIGAYVPLLVQLLLTLSKQ